MALKSCKGMTMIKYSTDKNFTKEQVKALFDSINWNSGKYPNSLYLALQNSQTVITAWDEDKLVGLTRAIDDGAMVAFVHYVLVDPKYQGQGIASYMMELITQKYKDFLYIDVMPEDKKNATFYQKFGFKVVDTGLAMSRINFDKKEETL